MDRKEVYQAIDSERDYQDGCIKAGDTHVVGVESFPLGCALTAIEVKLKEAKDLWYRTRAPHPQAMEELRKIAAICVQAGELSGMPSRGVIHQPPIQDY